MNKLIVYTRDECPSCTAVKRRLKALALPYEEQNVEHDEAARQRLKDSGLLVAPAFGWGGKIHTIAELPRITRELQAQMEGQA